MIDFNRNNLDKSSSPYLNQHYKNPVFWQEWSSEVIEYAKKNDKILFVSSGYSTCHWCHVMAAEAFSNQQIADFLNKNFVPIKIDREQRPDIDQFLMDVIISINKSGGWPLNVFLSADLKPITALTYAGVTAKYGLPDFLTILENVLNFYIKNKSKLQKTFFSSYQPTVFRKNNLSEIFYENFDEDYGGFGRNQKFHPHCTMLFLIHQYEEQNDKLLYEIITKTLDTINLSGLHDHLQGGFFRYCVDKEWTIPHFEKMLYDQAMLMWCFSAAYKVFKNYNYKTAVENIFASLIETFKDKGLFYSAHDADTEHVEGETYIWSYNELEQLLTENEFEIFTENYFITKVGNFEGHNHLIKKQITSNSVLENIEKKLLEIRKKRVQPFTDKKIITSWNALTGIALINAFRYLENEKYLLEAIGIYENLKKRHFIDNKLIHSSIENKFQAEEFLEDYASMLLFVTYLHEETNKYSDDLKLFSGLIEKFRKNKIWIEAENDDFMEIEAKYFDYPTPSSISMAEMAIMRKKILFGEDYMTNELYKELLNFDFLNISIFIKNGFFHIYESPKKIDWSKIPLNSFQKSGSQSIECYKGSCKTINNV